MSPEKPPKEKLKEKKNSETSAFSKNELFAEYIAANHELSVGMLDLSVRTYNCLKRNDIMTLSKIILAYPDDLKSMKNFGNKSFCEIEKLMYELHSKYDEQFINSANDTDDRKTDLISSMTIHELLSSDKYRHFINDFFEHLNLRIDNSGLSGKALRYLGRSGITEFNKLFVLYPDRIVSVAGSSNAVADELKKYIENTVDNYRLSINRYCCGDEQALYTDNFIKSQIMNVFGNAGFDGKSFAEMRAVIPEAVDEKRIRKAVAQLIKERKLEYVDFRCYKVYPSYQSYLREFIESLEENQRVMLCRRLKLNFKKWLKNSSNCGIIIRKERTGKVPDNIFKGIV